MNCEHIESKLVPYLLKDLSETEQSAVREHLDECESCRASVRELEQTLDLLGGALAAPFEAPVGLDEDRRKKIFTADKGSKPAKKPLLLHPLLLQVAAVLALLLVGSFLLLPSLSRSSKSPMNIAMEQDEKMDLAKFEKGRATAEMTSHPEEESGAADLYEVESLEEVIEDAIPEVAKQLPPPRPEPVPSKPSPSVPQADNMPQEPSVTLDGSSMAGSGISPDQPMDHFGLDAETRRTGGQSGNELKNQAGKQLVERYDFNGPDLDDELAVMDAPPTPGMDENNFGLGAFDNQFRDGLAKSDAVKENGQNTALGTGFNYRRKSGSAVPADFGGGGGGTAGQSGRWFEDADERAAGEKQISASTTRGIREALPTEGLSAEMDTPDSTAHYFTNGAERQVATQEEPMPPARVVTGPAPTASPKAPRFRATTLDYEDISGDELKDIGIKSKRRDLGWKMQDRRERERRLRKESPVPKGSVHAGGTLQDAKPDLTLGISGGSVATDPVSTARPSVSEPPEVAGTVVNGTYSVQPGDTLSVIAERENTSVDKLAELNKIQDPNTIQAGVELALPSGEHEEFRFEKKRETLTRSGKEEGAEISGERTARQVAESLDRLENSITVSETEKSKRANKVSGDDDAEEFVSEAGEDVSDESRLALLGDVPVTGSLFASRNQEKEVDGEPADRGEISEPVFRAYSFNPYIETAENAFSTFSIDVDTAAYTLARRYMINGSLPPPDAVRTEEFLNFFNYNYPAPKFGTFAVYSKAAPTPLGSGYLLKVGIKGKRIGREQQRNAYLTFVIDTSGSMDTRDRLGLARKSLRLLVDKLSPQDQVAIVQYSSQSRLVLEHTPASRRQEILEAIDALQVSGSTNLEQGLTMGYQVASRVFDPLAINRVLLVSDGAANLGAASAEEILSQVESYRKQGIFCSIFGFGIGTYNDVMLETLANKGNGSYQFIDSEEEARRVFVDDLSATLNTIASDVKIQVEFNPERVQQYRQLGYENRQLTKQQFRNDTVDAGEVGSGQSVTALYEVHLQGNPNLPLGTVRVRYRNLDTGEVEEIARPISAGDLVREFERTDMRFRLAAAVAAFAEKLRGSPFVEHLEYRDIAGVLRPVALELELDPYVQELSHLIQAASTLPRAAE